MTKETITNVDINPGKVRKRKRTPIENLEFFKNSNTISTAKSDVQDMLVEVDSAPQSLVHEHLKMDTDSTNNPVKETAAQKKNRRRKKKRKIRERVIGSVENSAVFNSSDIISVARSDVQDMLLEANSAPKSPVLEPPKIDTDSANNPIKESASQKKNRRRKKNRKIREREIGSVENSEVFNNSDIILMVNSDFRDMLPEANSAPKISVLEPPKIDTDSANKLIKESASQKKKRRSKKNGKLREREIGSVENSEVFNNGDIISMAKSDVRDMLPEANSAPKIPVLEPPKIDTGSAKNPIKESASKKKKRRSKKNRKIREREIGSVENSEVFNNGDNISMAKSDVRDMLQEANSAPKIPILEPPKIDTDSANNPITESATQEQNRKISEREIGSVENSEVLNNSDIILMAKSDVRDMLPEANSVPKIPVLEPPKIDTDSANNPVKESATQKKNRRRKINRKIRERMSSSIENPEVFNNIDIISVDKSNVQGMPLEVDSATQYPVHPAPKIDTDLANNAIKESPAQIKNREMNEKMYLTDNAIKESPAQIKHRKMKEKMKSIAIPEVFNNSDVIAMAKSDVQDMLLEVDSVPQYLVHEAPKIDTDSTNNRMKESAHLKKKRRKRNGRTRRRLSISMNKDGLGSTDQKDILQVSSVSGEKNPEVSATESKIERKNPSFDMIVTKHFPLAIINKTDNLLEASHPLPERSLVNYSRRKLLILDINGLLADVVYPPPKVCKADINILRRAVFKRPFCYDFLKFCFEKFDVGIWSSRTKKVIDRVVDYLLGDLKHKLLFCWDLSHSTETEFKTLENKHKPLVFKELKKIWEKHDPNLPWKKGDYNESNTLLLDDSPYKALLNPMHTAIFPYSYNFMDRSDNSLGPGGDLRVYLEDLAAAENIQKYVEHHPFGQNAISDTSPSWGFYQRVISRQFLCPEICWWSQDNTEELLTSWRTLLR